MQHGSTTSRDAISPQHDHIEDRADDAVQLIDVAERSLLGASQLVSRHKELMALSDRREIMARLKNTSAKAYSIYAITERCADQGDYTETHNEHIGSLALELYEALQELGIRISE